MLATVIRSNLGLEKVLANPTKVSLKIDINFTQLTPEEKAKFFSLVQTAPGLKEIDFSGCGLNDSGIDMLINSLSRHSHLTYLNLSGNHLTDTGAVLALKLPLEHLNLSNNRLTDEVFNLFYDDPPEEVTLRELILDNNALTAASLSKLSLMGLTLLSMKGYQFTIEALDALLQSTSLAHFNYDWHRPSLNPAPLTHFHKKIEELQKNNGDMLGYHRRIASACSLSGV